MKSNALEENKAGFISLSDLAHLVSGIPKDAFGEAAHSDPKNWKETKWTGYNGNKPVDEADGTHQSREWIGHSRGEHSNALDVINRFVKKLEVDIFSVHTGWPLCREPNAFDLVIGLLWWEDANKVLTAMRQTSRLAGPAVIDQSTSAFSIATQEALSQPAPNASAEKKEECQTSNPTQIHQLEVSTSVARKTAGSTNILKSVIEQAKKNALDKNDWASVWNALVSLAEKNDRPAPLIGSTEDGIKYYKDTEEKTLSREAYRSRFNREKEKAKPK